MFASRFFPRTFYAGRYFPHEPIPTPAPTPAAGGGSGGSGSLRHRWATEAVPPLHLIRRRTATVHTPPIRARTAIRHVANPVSHVAPAQVRVLPARLSAEVFRTRGARGGSRAAPPSLHALVCRRRGAAARCATRARCFCVASRARLFVPDPRARARARSLARLRALLNVPDEEAILLADF